MKLSVEEKQEEVLRMFQKDSQFRLGKRTIQFARVSKDELKSIQDMSTRDLILGYHSLTAIMEIGGFSLKDCELEILMALEMEKRKVTAEHYQEVVRNARRKVQTKDL